MGDFIYRERRPLRIARAYGPYLEDVRGRTYFDAEAANGAALLGYDHSLLEDALARVRETPALPSFVESDLRQRVAQKVGKMLLRATGKRGRVSFDVGGAQAIELAAKVARLASGKSLFVVFEGGYHGRSGYAAQLSASHRYRRVLGDWRIPLVRLPLPDYERSGFQGSKEVWVRSYLERVDFLLMSEAGGLVERGKADVAALLVEPILNVGGMVMPDKHLLREVVARFRAAGALVIFDEVFTGFYRTGKAFGFVHFGITPDIVAMSKGLTNGHAALSCVWAREPLLAAESFPPGTHSATYIHNMFALAVADVMLDRYAAWPTIERDVARLQRTLTNSIRTVCEASGVFRGGYALGGVGRIVLSGPDAARIRRAALRLPERARARVRSDGLLLASTGMTPDVLCIHPPINLDEASRAELAVLLEALRAYA